MCHATRMIKFPTRTNASRHTYACSITIRKYVSCRTIYLTHVPHNAGYATHVRYTPHETEKAHRCAFCTPHTWTPQIHDDDCFYYHSWRNNVVIAFSRLLRIGFFCGEIADIALWWSQSRTRLCLYFSTSKWKVQDWWSLLFPPSRSYVLMILSQEECRLRILRRTSVLRISRRTMCIFDTTLYVRIWHFNLHIYIHVNTYARTHHDIRTSMCSGKGVCVRAYIYTSTQTCSTNVHDRHARTHRVERASIRRGKSVWLYVYIRVHLYTYMFNYVGIWHTYSNTPHCTSRYTSRQ